MDIWNSGHIILNDYIIRGFLGQGGMGRVYLAEHLRFPGHLYAVKRLTPDVTYDLKNRRLFLNELRNWIDLPAYPHFIKCYFFRTVESFFTIFAEYAAGGSVAQWSLGESRSIDSILDLAIQMTRGIEALHRCGMIHQDIKPANMLLTRELTVKITDFGLARTRPVSAVEMESLDSSRNALVTYGGMTPAYCSPEQAMGGKLSLKTDLWSLGLSILQMFTGRATWKLGMMAPIILERLRAQTGEILRVDLPDKVIGILDLCFREDPAQRWESAGEIEAALREAYFELLGREYSRSRPEFPETPPPVQSGQDRTSAAGINWIDPEIFLVSGYRQKGLDPGDTSDFLPDRSGSPRAQALVDLEGYVIAEQIFDELLREGKSSLLKEYTSLLTNKASVLEFIDDLPGVGSEYLKIADHLERALTRTSDSELVSKLGNAYSNYAIACLFMGRFEESVEYQDRAISLHQKLLKHNNDPDLTLGLAMMYTNKALALQNLGHTQSVSTLFDEAIRLTEPLALAKQDASALHNLAKMYINKCNLLKSTGHLEEVLPTYDRAIEIISHLMESSPQKRYKEELALVLTNKANTLCTLGDFGPAMHLYDKAIRIRRELLLEDRHYEIANRLASVYANKSLACNSCENYEEALALIDEAISIRERIVFEEGHTELIGKILTLYVHRADILAKLGQLEPALELYEKIERLMLHENFHSDTQEMRLIRLMMLKNRAAAYQLQEADHLALEELDKAFRLAETITMNAGHLEFLLVFTDMSIMQAQLKYGAEPDKRRKEIEKILDFLQPEIQRSKNYDLQKLERKARQISEKDN